MRSPPAFPAGSYAYTLAIDGDSANITLTPTAANKNYLVRTYLNVKDTGAAEGSALYKRTESIPVTAGDVIYVGCGRTGMAQHEQSGDRRPEITLVHGTRCMLSAAPAAVPR